MTDIKTTVSTFWSTNSTLIIKIIVGIVLLVALVFIGQWYAGRTVNQLAADLRAKAMLDNRALYDNLAVLKDRTLQLETQYSVQKSEIVTIRNNQRGGATSAFKNPDKKVAASYFDNAVDSYVPSK